jgi:hypothetical protein
MIGILRGLLVVALGAIVFEIAFLPREAHRALDPDEPIAADGSMIAGKARTIYDTNPLLGAFGEQPRPDPDDPKDFERWIEIDRPMHNRARDQMAQVLGALDASRCEDAERLKLIDAVQLYYRTRGNAMHSFTLRGPHAKAAMEAEWSTLLDRRIDDFVRRALLSGVLHKNEVPANVYPEFDRVFADTKEIGSACPPLKRVRGDEKL